MSADSLAREQVAYLRMLAADHLITPDGPMLDTLTAWLQVAGSRCAHLDEPQPVYGLLCEPGARMCGDCFQATCQTIGVVQGIAPCDGCAAEIHETDVEAAKTLIAIDEYTTIAGHACPSSCRSLCDPS